MNLIMNKKTSQIKVKFKKTLHMPIAVAGILTPGRGDPTELKKSLLSALFPRDLSTFQGGPCATTFM